MTRRLRAEDEVAALEAALEQLVHPEGPGLPLELEAALDDPDTRYVLAEQLHRRGCRIAEA